jgi:hypothetical protein
LSLTGNTTKASFVLLCYLLYEAVSIDNIERQMVRRLGTDQLISISKEDIIKCEEQSVYLP